MNPASFFREVLESHEFRSSDNFGAVIRRTAHVFEHIIFTPDNARLLDIRARDSVRRFLRYLLAESAVLG